jgi:hypothetical protein
MMGSTASITSQGAAEGVGFQGVLSLERVRLRFDVAFYTLVAWVADRPLLTGFAGLRIMARLPSCNLPRGSSGLAVLPAPGPPFETALPLHHWPCWARSCLRDRERPPK